MDLIQQIILAVIQGFTEFLPISSSAHLILVPTLLGWQDQGLVFDVAVHVGTLCAVVIYFRQQLGHMARDWFGSIRNHQMTAESRLAWGILLGTIPVGLCGLLFKDLIELHLRSPVVIALSTILFGLLLWWSDYFGRRQRDEYSLTWLDILFIGVVQAIALVPGTSRSGITMTAALIAGLNRQAAARFSFLLSIPVISLAGLLAMKDLLQQQVNIEFSAIVTGTIISGVTAYACIHFFLKLLERIGMLPFVIYRLLLGAVLLLLFY